MKNSIVLLALLIAAGTFAATTEPAELSKLRERYDRQARTALQPLLQNYARDLENLATRLSLARDLDGARQAQNELEKIKTRLAELADKPILASPQVIGKKTAGQNVVVNPGFEAGTTDGWFITEATAKADRGERSAHSGRYVLRLRRTDSPKDMAGVLQDLAGKLEPGSRVHGSAWVKLSSDAGPDKGVLLVALKDTTGTKILQLISKTARATGDWEQLTLDFILPTKKAQPDLGSIHMFVGIAGTKDIGDMLIDDVYIGPSAETP